MDTAWHEENKTIEIDRIMVFVNFLDVGLGDATLIQDRFHAVLIEVVQGMGIY